MANNDDGRIDIVFAANDKSLKTAIRQNARDMEDMSRKFQNEGGKIDDMFKKLGASVAAFFTIQQASSMVKQIASVRGEFQQLEVAFGTMLQSESKAASLMNQLVKTAATTPFGLQDVAGGAKQLLAYGFAADEVNQTLIDLGNIAAGLSIPLNDLVYLYGTTMTQGRVYTQDMRQFMGRGIPLADELATQLGRNKNEIDAMVTAGKIGFADVEKAIKSMSGEGGKFANLMEKQSHTITGQISNIEDAFSMMLNDIGKQSEGVINSALQSVSWLVENYERVGKVLADVALAYGAYKASVMAGVAIQNIAIASTKGWTLVELAHFKALKALEVAQKALNKTMLTNPYVLLTAAVVGLGVAMTKLALHTSAAEKAQKELNKAQAAVSSGTYDSQYMKEARELKLLADQLNSAEKGTTAWESAKDALIEKYGAYDEKLKDELEKTGKIADSYERINAALVKAAKVRGYSNYVQSQEDSLQKSVDDATEKARELFEKKLKDKTIAGYTAGSAYSSVMKYVYGDTDHLESYLKAVLDGSFKVDFQEIEEARQAVKKLETIREDARKIFDLTEEDVKVKEPEEKKRDTGQSDPDSLIKARKAALQKRLEMEKAVGRQRVDLENQNEEQLIAAMEDGLDKTLRQLAFSHKKEKEALQKQEEDTLKLLQEQEKAKWQAKHPDEDAGVKFTTSIKELPEEWRGMYDRIYKAMADAQMDAYTNAMNEFSDNENEMIDANEKAFNNAFNAYMKQYGTLEEKRAAIQREYEQKMLDAGAGEAGDMQRRLLQKQMEEALASFDMANESTYRRIFGDPSKMTKSAISGAIDIAKKKLKELNRETQPDQWKALVEALDRLEDARDTFDLSGIATGWESVLRSAVMIRREQERINAMKAEGSKYTQAEIDDAEDRLARLKGDLGKSTLLTAISEAASKMGEIAGYMNDVAEISGDGRLKDAADSLASVANVIGSTAAGAASGGWIGAIVGGASSIVGEIVNAAMTARLNTERMTASLKEYGKTLEVIGRTNDYDTIFGVNALEKARGEMDAARESYEAYQKALTEFSQMQWTSEEARREYQKLGGKAIASAVIGDWGGMARELGQRKQMITEYYKEISTSLKDTIVAWGNKDSKRKKLSDIYPEIFDEDGNLILDKAEAALANYAGSKEGKYGDTAYKALADNIELLKEYEGHVKEVDAYIESLIGNVGDDLADAILSGADAFDTLEDAAADFINSYTKDLVKMTLLEGIGDAYKEKIRNAIASDNEGDLIAVLTDMNADISANIDKAREIADRVDSAAGAAGIDTEGARKASASGIAQASQDSIDELNGRFTAIQGHTASIRDNVSALAERSSQILSHVMGIHTDTTSMSSRLNSLARDVAAIKDSL